MTPTAPEKKLAALQSLKNAVEKSRASTILVDSENLYPPAEKLLLSSHLAKQRRLARFTLLIGVSDLLHQKAGIEGKQYPERTAYCLRLKVPNKTPMIMHSPAEKKARYKNMRTCGSVWACPVCGARISEVRRGELAQGLEAATALGWQIFMLTFTLQHSNDQPLRAVLDMLKSAYADFRVGKQWTKTVDRLAIEGTVQGKETTHGDNGWHPHLHVLFFSSLRELPADAAADFFKKRWVRMVAKHGGYATYASGLEMTISTDTTLVEYPAKMGLADLDISESSDFSFKKSFTIASEIAKANVKQGRGSGRTPLQLVAAAMTGDQHAARLWIEFYDVFKGQRQLWWSQGLKEKLGIAQELTDEQIAESALTDELELIALTDEILSALNKHERSKNARGVLLEIASGGNVDQVWSFLQGLGVNRPSDEVTYRRMRIDLDQQSVTDLGTVSGNLARLLIEADKWSVVLEDGDSDE